MDWLQLLALAFVAVGVLFVGVGVRNLRADRRLRRRGRSADAEITDIRYEWRGTPGERSLIPFAVLRFALPDGRTVETRSGYGLSWPPAKVGDRVEIVYDPENPGRARIVRGLTGAAPTILGVGMIVLGTLLALFGAGFFVLVRALERSGLS
jgi:hypothetical protein